MEIETANSSDLERIVHLKMAMFKEAGIEHLLLENSKDRIYQDYKEMYSNSDAIHYAIRVDGIIVSIAGAFIKSDIPYRYFKNTEYGFIGDVYTVSEFRRNGLATKKSLRGAQGLGSAPEGLSIPSRQRRLGR